MKNIFLWTSVISLFIYTDYGRTEGFSNKTTPIERSNDILVSSEDNNVANQDKHFEELASFVEIPSISSLPAHSADMKRAAAWLVKKLGDIGMTTAEAVPTAGHPVVFSSWLKAKGKPTVLIYGHYDVQPVDEKQWISDPFKASLRNGRIYGRGATDDKGGLLIPVWVVEKILKEKGALPVNVIFLFDGEEEIGSPNFRQFLEQYKSRLLADFAYNADGAQYNDTIPSIWMGLRGNASLELTVKTANTDSHSGLYGGKTPNASRAAAEIISSLYAPDGKVAVKGFYDLVQPISSEEKQRLLEIPYDSLKDMNDLGTRAEVGDKDYSSLERIWYRPTIEVTGVWSGYTAAEGFANIIPGTAHIRLNCRLVPNQDGKEIIRLVRNHINAHCPKGALVTFKEFESYAAPMKFPATGSSFQFAQDVLTEIYNKKPLLTAVGGSIAAMTYIKDILGLYTYSFGFQQTDENFHAANEFIRLTDIEKGERAYHLLLERIGNSKIK